MAKLHVLSDGRIVEHLFNPAPGQVVAEVEIQEPSIPFNPMTFLTDGHSDEARRLRQEAEAEAEEIAKQYRSE